MEEAQRCVDKLKNEDEKYLEYGYFTKIKSKYTLLTKSNENIIRNAYAFIMNKLGVEEDENGNMKAFSCSPYLYLQILYQYQGGPKNSLESFLAIDEAQGIAPEEIRLLYNINDGRAVFNMFGDVYQHVEGTKGINSWSEYNDVLDFDMYEMQENYRNASQITEFCNKQFNMNMLAINTPGKGVHELLTDTEFYNEMITQLVDIQRTGLAAILIRSDAEARYLLNRFPMFVNKFHDMTSEESGLQGLHRTRWNIINIDDAKGLEFSSVIVLSGRMSRNEKYIAYTRALDELFVYSDIIDITEFDEKSEEERKTNIPKQQESTKTRGKHGPEKKCDDEKSEVRDFLEKSKFEVIDNRKDGGKLWIIGEKKDIRDTVNSAIAKFGISGKYASSKETKFRNGWYTKTNK